MVENRLVQKIEKHVDFKVEYHDLENECASDMPSGDSSVSEILDQFIRPFDLSGAPLFRVVLIKVAKKEYILMFDIHHIINDGVSTDIMAREFGKFYWGESLPPLRIRYKDFSQWQNSKTIKEKIKKQESYWLKEFEQDIPLLNILSDAPRPVLQSLKVAGLSL
jgi:bacitracin synthase 3